MHHTRLFCLHLVAILHLTPIHGRSEIDLDILARLEALETQVSTQHRQLDRQNDLIVKHRSLIKHQQVEIAKHKSLFKDQQIEIAHHKATIQKMEETSVEQQAHIVQQKASIDEQQRRVLYLENTLKTRNGNTLDPDETVVDAIAAKTGVKGIYTKRESFSTQRSLNGSADNVLNQDIADNHPSLGARLVLGGEGPVAFHAVNPNGQTAHVGINQKVIFNKVNLNLGNGFHSLHGIFTAPTAGLYIFSTSVLTWIQDHTEIRAALLKNGVTLAKAFGHGDSGRHDQGSVTVVTQLAVGDEVWVSLIELSDDSYYGGYYTSFTGCLLWQV